MKIGLKYWLGAAVAFLMSMAPGFAQSISGVIDQNTQGAYGPVGSQVVISGSGFTSGQLTSVSFNGTEAISGSVTADTQIIATIPTGASSGLVSVTVGGVKVYSPGMFVVIGSGPYVTGFSPSVGSAGVTVTITGYQLTTVTNVEFNGVVASGNVEGDTRLSVTVPANVTTGPITVTSAHGTFVTSSNFFVPSVITSFSPLAGRAGTNVTLLGSNFTSATGVYFDGLPASFVVNSPSNITAVVPAGFSTGPISLTAPGGGFVTSANFTALPTILGFTPAGGPAGTKVTINGLDFGAGSVTVEFNGAAAAGVNNLGGTNLTAVVPNNASTGPITIITSIGTSVSTNLFYLPPNLFSISPPGGVAGTTVTFSGEDFSGVTNVLFGSLRAAFMVVNDSTITAQAPAGVLTAPVVLNNPGGSSSSSAVIYYYGPPVITSMSTNAGGAGANITIVGANFIGLTNLTFGGIAATTTTVANNTTIIAVVPSGVVSGPVTINTLGGSYTTSAPFYGPPSISSVSPGSGFPGASVTITGGNFLGVTSVGFGSAAASFSYVNNGSILATVPAGFTNGLVTVTTPGGLASSSTVFTQGAAALTIELLSGGGSVVAWPLALSNWVLQVTSSLTPPVEWTPSSTPAGVFGGQNVVTNPASSLPLFFRLKH